MERRRSRARDDEQPDGPTQMSHAPAPLGRPTGVRPAAAHPTAARPKRLAIALAVFGPGLVVMLADTDVGSVITAGQSGVQWGYRLLALQLVLIPILYMVQELTVRLGIFTGRGHGELICQTFGHFWGWVSATGLGIATTGALLTEFSGVAGVGELYGVPRFASLPIAAVALARGGAHRLLPAGGAGGDHPGPVRARVLLRRLGGASRSRRDCSPAARHSLRQQGLSVPGGGQYRRGGDAVDDLLPAVRGRR